MDLSFVFTWLGFMVIIALVLTLLMAIPARWAYRRDKNPPPAE